MKSTMGRPTLPAGKARNVVICARFSKLESVEINQAIKRDGLEKPEWVRNSLLTSARSGNLKPL
jgi:hypothetical protein